MRLVSYNEFSYDMSQYTVRSLLNLQYLPDFCCYMSGTETGQSKVKPAETDIETGMYVAECALVDIGTKY